MAKRIVLLIGGAAIIWSLLTPIIVTEKVKTGETVPTNGYLYSEARPIYQDVIKTDTYKTNTRTIAIALGALVLWYVVPGKKRSE